MCVFFEELAPREAYSLTRKNGLRILAGEKLGGIIIMPLGLNTGASSIN